MYYFNHKKCLTFKLKDIMLKLTFDYIINPKNFEFKDKIGNWRTISVHNIIF